MSREEDRQNKRVDPSCKTATDPLGCVTKPTSRRIADACGDIELPDPCNIDVSKFFEPQPLEVPDLVTPNLPWVSVGNTEITRTCLQLPGTTASILGDAVTAAAGQLDVVVYFSGIEDITLLQRQHLATISQGALDTWPNLTAAQIAEAGQLTLAQATALLAAFSSAQAQADSNATALALSQLECRYENVEQIAECPNDADVGEGVPEVVIAAGAYASQISQADADAQAQAAAEAGLRCVWSNAAQSTSCAATGLPAIPDNDDNDPVDFAYDPDANPQPDPDAQVNTATVPAGTVLSVVSKDDANATAAALALSFLNCFYLNEEKTGSCVAGYAGSSAISTVPGGSVTSRESVSAANTQAQAIADAQTVCRYANTVQTFTCDDPDNPSYDLGKDAGGDYQLASPQAPVGASLRYSVTVGAGDIVSDVSVEDANQQAKTLALAQLECAWCNDAVGAVCAPPLVTSSIDETDGTAADTYCASSYLLAQELAVAAAAVTKRAKVEGSPTCRYENEAVRATCYPEAVPEVGDVSKYTALEAAAKGALSSTSASQFIIVSKGAIVSVVSAAAATETAKNIALAQLDCFWENNEQFCPTTEDPVTEETVIDPETGFPFLDPGTGLPFKVHGNPVPEFTVRSYEGKEEANTLARGLLFCEVHNVAAPAACPLDAADNPASANGVTAFTTSPGLFVQALAQNDTPEEVMAAQKSVNALAGNFAEAQLDCFWESDPETFTCPAGVSPNSSNNVETGAGQFVSYTGRQEANDLRDAYGNALLDCFYENVRVEVTCGDTLDTLAPQLSNSPGAPVGTGTQPLVGGNTVVVIFYSMTGRSAVITGTTGPGFGAAVTSVLSDRFLVTLTPSIPYDGVPRSFSWAVLEGGSVIVGTALGRLDGANQVYPGSSPSVPVNKLPIGHVLRPAIVGASTARSYGNQTEANTMAVTIALGQLDCKYSASASVDCTDQPGSPFAIEKAGSVSFGSIFSFTTQADAQTLADTLAAGLRVCVPVDDIGGIGAPGAAGSPGANGSSCSNTCVGFYG
jgi:hypothetical protein